MAVTGSHIEHHVAEREGEQELRDEGRSHGAEGQPLPAAVPTVRTRKKVPISSTAYATSSR
jgi:hypothetical protein